mgnify:CR=1 FL=1
MVRVSLPKEHFVFLIFVLIPMFSFSQRTSVGFYYGLSIGYNAIYGQHSADAQLGLLDVNLNSEEPFFSSLSMFNDDDFTNGVEFINGAVFGIKANLPVLNGVSIQPEIQYQQLDFNHIVYQNGNAVFNDLTFALSGLYQDSYKISNYFWKVNYLNFPFVLKLYPVDNLFFEVGGKFGFLLKAEETPAFATFNRNNAYVSYDNLYGETVVYEFFDTYSIIDNHGFDKNEWPFNWTASTLIGVGYENKSMFFSLRYSLGLLDFFKEINNKDNDFFDNYNVYFDDVVYNSFEVLEPIVNNNFKLQTIYFSIGYHISN